VLAKKGNISATLGDKYQETNPTLKLMPRCLQADLLKKALSIRCRIFRRKKEKKHIYGTVVMKSLTI
jgi:hypothetical protein